MDKNYTLTSTGKTNWVSVIVYYLIACLISWPFFWWRDIETESWNSWNVPSIVKTASYMWGPGISAIICLIIFRKIHVRKITFFGTSVLKSLAFYIVPIIPLAIFSIPGDEAYMIPIFGFVMILGEELGWRGFLQDALNNLSPLKKYMLIGAMWEMWHFTTRMSNGLHISTFVKVGVFLIGCIVISYIAGALTDKTKSIVVAVTLHSWTDILVEYSSTSTYVIFGLSLIFWSYLIWTWGKKSKKFVNPDNSNVPI